MDADDQAEIRRSDRLEFVDDEVDRPSGDLVAVEQRRGRRLENGVVVSPVECLPLPDERRELIGRSDPLRGVRLRVEPLNLLDDLLSDRRSVAARCPVR